MSGSQRPLQNRVTPFGDVIAIAQRGRFIGNRGIIHDPVTKTLLGRRWTTKAWLVCVLDYKGRHRDCRGWQGLHDCAGPRVPLERARLSGGATNPSRRRVADPTRSQSAPATGLCYTPTLKQVPV